MIQLQFLNSLLNTRDASILLVNNIDDSFFSDYREEFNFLKNHINQYSQVPDKITFANKFPHFDFIEVNENSNYLVDALYQDKNTRMLATTFNQVRDLVNSGNIDDAISIYTHAAENLATATHIQAVDILKDKTRYDKYVERSQDFSKYYVKTGFSEVDAVIGGWDRLEELGTIVARPGVGKSWVLLKCATAGVEQGLRVGLYSGEMSELKVGYRADTLIGHISNRGIIRGDVEVQNEYKRYIDALENRFKGSLFVITPEMLKHTATVTDLRAFIEKYNLDMLCIDQHSLLEDERKAKDSITRASNISRDLKNLQVMKKIPIIAVSQQNRSSIEDGAVIDVSHIAQTDRIGQDSTVVLVLEQKDGVLTIHISKARDSSAVKKLKYAIDLDKGIFSFIPNEDDALSGQGCDELRNEYAYSGSGEAPF